MNEGGHPIMSLSRKKLMAINCSKFKRIKISGFLDIAPLKPLADFFGLFGEFLTTKEKGTANYTWQALHIGEER